MTLEFPFTGSSILADWRNNWLHKRLWFDNKHGDRLCFCPSRRTLGTDADISKTAKVNTPKNKKNAPAAEPGTKRRKRTRDKLIRLDDLIPEKDVKGGHQVLFGVTEKTQINEKGK